MLRVRTSNSHIVQGSTVNLFFFLPYLLACRILVSHPRIEARARQWKCKVLTTGLQGSPGNSMWLFFFFFFWWGDRGGRQVFNFLLFLNIYFWLHWVFVAARGPSLAVMNRGYSSLWCTGFSCGGFSSFRAQALDTWSSVLGGTYAL